MQGPHNPTVHRGIGVHRNEVGHRFHLLVLSGLPSPRHVAEVGEPGDRRGEWTNARRYPTHQDATQRVAKAISHANVVM